MLSLKQTAAANKRGFGGTLHLTIQGKHIHVRSHSTNIGYSVNTDYPFYCHCRADLDRVALPLIHENKKAIRFSLIETGEQYSCQK